MDSEKQQRISNTYYAISAVTIVYIRRLELKGKKYDMKNMREPSKINSPADKHSKY